MHSDTFFGRVFEDMRGPERAVDIGAEVFEFRGHATVEDVDSAKEIFTRYVAFDHVFDGNCLRRRTALS